MKYFKHCLLILAGIGFMYLTAYMKFIQNAGWWTEPTGLFSFFLSLVCLILGTVRLLFGVAILFED